MERSGSFICKKWSLFSVTLLAIIGSIIFISVASSLVDSLAKSDPTIYTQDVKSYVKSWIIAAGVISILFNLLGLLGAYKEHFCMTVSYAILMTLGTLGTISVALKTSSYWASFVINAIITVLAYAYARDLNILRHQLFATPIIVSPAQPQTVVQIHPGYSGQQFSNPSSGWQPQSGGWQPQSGGWQPPPPAYNAGQYNNSKAFNN